MRLSDIKEERTFKYKVKNVKPGDIVVLSMAGSPRWKVTRKAIPTPSVDQGLQWLGVRWIKTRKIWSKQVSLLPLHAVDRIEK